MLAPTTNFPQLFTTNHTQCATGVGENDGAYYGCYVGSGKAHGANWNDRGAMYEAITIPHVESNNGRSAPDDSRASGTVIRLSNYRVASAGSDQ